MKCRFACDVEVNPQSLPDEYQSFVVQLEGKAIFPKGTEYETPHALTFVLNGMADPADEECKAACKKTAEELAELKRRHARIEAGILHDDIPLFDAGYISGYLANGDYKPGDKWQEYCDLLAAEDAEDSE